MKFLFIFHDRPNYSGGPIVNARRLLPELRRRGHELHCLLLYGGDEAPSREYLEKHDVKCYVRPLRGYTETHVKWILHRVADVQPDIFIPNLLVSGWFAARWVREAGIPTVAVMRSDDIFHWAMIDQFVTGPREWAVSGLVCVSEGLRCEIQRKESRFTKLCVIPSGVPVSTDSRLRRSKSEHIKLVYVGRMVQEQKRVLDMIDALALVMGDNADISATLIGDGEQRSAIERRIWDYGLRERIDILSVVPCEQIQAKLADFDILVLLSDYEGTPGAVMDGMAAGLVPVCLDIPGGVRELVIHEQTGLLVKNRKDDFVRSIARLAADDILRNKLSSNARAHVKKHYSLEVAADRWETFSAELVSESGRRFSLSIPRFFSLPPLHPGLAREDKRRIPLVKRMFRAIIRGFSRDRS